MFLVQSLCILKLEFMTNGATKVRVISVHVKLYLCVAGTCVRARPRVGRWWVKMPGPFFNPSPSLTSKHIITLVYIHIFHM